jgi:hypothetical protein
MLPGSWFTGWICNSDGGPSTLTYMVVGRMGHGEADGIHRNFGN